MSDAFEKWFKTEMLPAECDDERVMVGMRLCWDAAVLHAAEVEHVITCCYCDAQYIAKQAGECPYCRIEKQS